MNLRKYIYTKRQLLSRYFALRFTRSRAFTPLQLIIKTLRANHYLPEKIIALEVFGFIGTSTTLDYQDLTDYLELWELDPYYAKQAQRIVPKAKVICGNSVEALAQGKVLRNDYNFVLIDSNPSSGASYESFGVFENTLKYLSEKAIIIVTIYTDLEKYASLYATTTANLDQNWIAARKKFYGLENTLSSKGIDYLPAFEKIIAAHNFKMVQSQFLSRNEAVGFGTFVVEKRVSNN